jgi:hypothetical protein
VPLTCCLPSFSLSHLQYVYLFVQLHLRDDFASESLSWIVFEPRDVDLAVGASSDVIVHVNDVITVNHFGILIL